MTTTDHPTGQLTRRQLREMRLTGQTPVITQDQLDEAAAAKAAESAPAPTPAPLPCAVETVVPPAPQPVATSGDSDHQPRTRRQAREAERVRTAGVPVIVPSADAPVGVPAPAAPAQPVAEVVEAPAPAAEPVIEELVPAFEAPVVEDTIEPVEVVEPEPTVGTEADAALDDGHDTAPRVAADFGEAILADPQVAAEPAVPSFDAVLTRDSATSGSASGGSALILPDSALAPLTAPVASSGRTLITGTFSLPESLSSQGHAGAADGRDVDAVLIDGELAPASSPTPIAATAAVSQAKAPGEIIKPPAPEKGNKLMLALAITAGALALTLGAVIVVALVNGALQ